MSSNRELRELGEMVATASFPKYSQALIKIEDEGGALVPFKLNEAQRVVWSEVTRQQEQGRPVRVAICKGRQQGMSTLLQMYLAWKMFTTPGARCLTVSHTLASVHSLYDKVERAWSELPEVLRPERDTGGERGRRMRMADPLRSFYRADSAHDPESVGRGMTLHHVHLSEAPQFRQPEETAQAVLATVPDHPDTSVFIESTAKGASGWFYEVFLEGMNALSRGEEPEIMPVFVPWYLTERYTRSKRSGEPDLTPAELEFQKKYNLTEGQVRWYRDQRTRYGDRVTEEYPSEWREAFLSSGMSFFDREALAHYRDNRREPLKRGRYRTTKRDGKTRGAFQQDWQGPTHIFADPDKDHSYVIGVDFASGRARDHSSIIVLDKDARSICATHRSKMMPEDVLAEAVFLGHAYNRALIVPERSGIGVTLVDRLVHDWGYQNTYRETDPSKVRFHKAARFGWATSNSTKAWLLEEMAMIVNKKSIEIPDTRIIEEMGTFVYLDDEGKLAGAGEGAYDDMVMGMAFAIRGLSAAAPMQRFIDRKRPKRPER